MLVALLVPTLVCGSLGNGILPLLPLYALHVGALAAAAAVTAFGVVLVLCVRLPRAAARHTAPVSPP